MSREYMVLFVTPNTEFGDPVEGASAEVLMRFTEEPTAEYLAKLAASRPGERVYCLMGASTWHEASKPRSYQYTDEQCPGHVSDTKICTRCGTHIHELDPDG